MTPEERKEFNDLKAQVRELSEKLRKLDKQSIKIVGTLASTTVPVTLNGIRRKITHAAP